MTSIQTHTFNNRTIEVWNCPIEETGADVIINSTGKQAKLSTPISRSILSAGGQHIKEIVQRHTPITPGQIVISDAGTITQTHYIFHTVITSYTATGPVKKGYADPNLILRMAHDAIRLADILQQTSIAFPPIGTGKARGQASTIQALIKAIVKELGQTKYVKTIIFASPSTEWFATFYNDTVMRVQLQEQELALRQELPNISPVLYSAVGDLVLKLRAAYDTETAADAFKREMAGIRATAEALKLRSQQLEQAQTPNTQIATISGTIVNIINSTIGGDVVGRDKISMGDVVRGDKFVGGAKR